MKKRIIILALCIVCAVASIFGLTACGDERGETGGEQGGSVAVNEILLNSKSIGLSVGETSTLKATVFPLNATYSVIMWSSSDPSVATVSNGTVTAKKAGTTVITAMVGGVVATCTVTVKEADVKGPDPTPPTVVVVSEITLSETKFSLTIGKTHVIRATVSPANATNPIVIWESSDTSVATVSNGIVTAKEVGTAIITATAGGKSAVCTVTVEEEIPVGLSFAEYRVGYAVTGYSGDATTVKVPRSYKGKTVLAIGTGIGDGFAFSSGITEIVLPDTIQQIGMEAFAYCAALRTITIPSCLSIGANAFANCASLQEIVLPESCLTIEGSIFTNCTSLKKVTILGGTLARNTLSGCSAVTDLKLGSKVYSIASQIVKDCPNLTNLEVANVDCLQFKLAEVGKEEVLINVTGGTYIPDQTEHVSVTVGGTTVVTGYPKEGTTWRLQDKTISVDGKTAYNEGYPVEVLTWKTESAYGLSWKAPASAKVRCYYMTSNLKKVTVTEQQLSLQDERIAGAPCEVVVLNRYPIDGIEVDGETEKYIDEFDLSQYRLNISRTSGEKEKIEFLPEYLSQADRAKLGTVGIHTVQINYGGYSQKWTVTLKNHSFDNAVMQSQEFYYDGTVKSLAVIGAPADTKITYTNNDKVAVGVYTVTVKLEKQYYDTKEITATLTVKTNEYTIVYNLGLSGVENPNPQIYKCTQGLELSAPQKSAYEFLGWYSDAAFTKKVTKIDIGTEGKQTLYAKWQSIFTMTNGSITGLTTYGKEYVKSNTDIVIDSIIDGIRVTSIGNSAFSGCSNLTSITIPNSVTSIGEYAFSGCSSLTSITIPESITSIGSYAFYNCSKLTSITIGNSVTSIGDRAFSGCSRLTSITIPDSVTSIGDYAFSDCSRLTSITIPNSVTSIGSSAFYNCSSLTSITIPDSVTSIGYHAFSGCSGLTIYCEAKSKPNEWNDSWKSDNSPVVWNCNNNDKDENGYEYDVIDGIRYALKGSVATVVQQPSSITQTRIPTIVTYKSSQYSVTSIGERAFYYCSSLTSITIPDSVTSIGEWAFSGCSGLTSVTIPDSVTSIEGFAFAYCSKLTSVTFENTQGWSARDNYSSSFVVISSSRLSNKATAATYLTSTYKTYTWTRK